MKPEERFLRQPKSFWAMVRTISQHLRYTVRRQVKVPTLDEVKVALSELGLDHSRVVDDHGQPTAVGKLLLDYFSHRAEVLNTFVEPRLMDAERAKRVFDELYAELSPTCPIPMNKQKGDKKAPAYLTSIVNMLIEANIEDSPCNYDPRELTTITRNGVPLRTLARRVDGAFPGAINPIAVWEIKEYYYTTTFGSRVADGVYESLLDGMELEELREHEGIDVKHYLMIDAHYTWWDCGRSYLCRIVDMLHMGYVDEVLFGYEVVERMPIIAKEWMETWRSHDIS
ncbi:MAG: DUF7687 domain-containing protein [Rubrobacteraceae bacterium]